MADLVAALSDPEAQAEAAEALRALIDKIVLTLGADTPDRHRIGLYLDLAMALALGNGGAAASSRESQESVVAGTGFEPVTFRL